MRIPWGTPTVSDATKLGLVRTLANNPATGERLYQLLYLAAYSTDWPDATGWTENDSGANVNLAGGVWSMNGNGSWTGNGIYKTTGHARALGYVEVKMKTPAAGNLEFGVGLSSLAALNLQVAAVRVATDLYPPGLYVYQGVTVVLTSVQSLTANTWYTVRIYPLQRPGGTWDCARITYEGGTQFPTETVVIEWYMPSGTVVSDPFYPVITRYHNNAGNPNSCKEYRWYSGYATDNPTLTYVADAGAGRIFNNINWTNVTTEDGFTTTNLRFKRSIDSGVPAYDAGWLTFAQLKALGTQAGARYVRLQVQFNSDGVTQQYGGSVNADDACTLIDEAARNTIIPTQVLSGENYIALGVPSVGEYACPGCTAPYCPGVIDAQPYAQGCILVRFYEMFCYDGAPYRYDFHIKRLLDGALTQADIDNGTYYSCSFYQDQISADLYDGSPYGPFGIAEVVLALESPGDSGDNIHLFTNQQYQIAVRAVAISGNTVAEDDNAAVVTSWSSGYQGITHMTIIDWPCLELCAPVELEPVTVESLPDITISDIENIPPLAVQKMPNLDVHPHKRGE